MGKEKAEEEKEEMSIKALLKIKGEWGEWFPVFLNYNTPNMVRHILKNKHKQLEVATVAYPNVWKRKFLPKVDIMLEDHDDFQLEWDEVLRDTIKYLHKKEKEK